MKIPIQHLPNPRNNWPVIAIAIYAGSGLITLAIIAAIYHFFN